MSGADANAFRKMHQRIPPCEGCRYEYNCAEHPISCAVFRRWHHLKDGEEYADDGRNMPGVRDPGPHEYRVTFGGAA